MDKLAEIYVLIQIEMYVNVTSSYHQYAFHVRLEDV